MTTNTRKFLVGLARMISTKMDPSGSSFSPNAMDEKSRSQRQEQKQADKNRAIFEYLEDVNKEKKEKRQARSYEEQTMDHWDCKMADILPVELRPRSRQPNGKPNSRGQRKTSTLPPNAWSKSFKRSLLKLASATSRDRDFAHGLLAKHVRSRQSTRSHSEFYARECIQLVLHTYGIQTG